MNRRKFVTTSLLIGIGVAILFVTLKSARPKIDWERHLHDDEYVSCLGVSKTGSRPVLVAGIQLGNYGSRDFDNCIICFDLETGDEIWVRRESENGNLRGGKHPSSIHFDKSGNPIIGWEYSSVAEGEYEVVSKHSAEDGSLIWEWATQSEGPRPKGRGFRHGAWIVGDGPEILVKNSRSIFASDGYSDVRDFYEVIDSNSGVAVSGFAALETDAKERWLSCENSLEFMVADGSKVTWGIHGFDQTKTNWLRWHLEDGLLRPRSSWKSSERIKITRIPPEGPSDLEQTFVGRDGERAILLLYEAGAKVPNAALLIDISEDIEIRPWRVVEISERGKVGRTLAYGTGISHNYDGPITLTHDGFVVVSGSLLQDHSLQKITVWKTP